MAFLLDMYGVFSEQVIVSYTQQILRGLAYLHENHVLHRDLKGRFTCMKTMCYVETSKVGLPV